MQPIALLRSRLASTGKPISARVSEAAVDVGDAGDDEVLLAREADVPALAGRELCHGEHLVAGDQAEVHRCTDRADPCLVLRLDAHVVGGIAIERLEREVGQRVAEAQLDLFPHPLRSAIVDHELHPSFDARDAVAQILLPGIEQRPHHRHRLVLADPDAEVAGEPGHR